MSLGSAFFLCLSIERICRESQWNDECGLLVQRTIDFIHMEFFRTRKQKEKKTQNSFNRYICNKQQHLDGSKAKAFSGVQGCGRERDRRRKKKSFLETIVMQFICTCKNKLCMYTPILAFYIHQSTVLHSTKKKQRKINRRTLFNSIFISASNFEYHLSSFPLKFHVTHSSENYRGQFFSRRLGKSAIKCQVGGKDHGKCKKGLQNQAIKSIHNASKIC